MSRRLLPLFTVGVAVLGVATTVAPASAASAAPTASTASTGNVRTAASLHPSQRQRTDDAGRAVAARAAGHIAKLDHITPTAGAARVVDPRLRTAAGSSVAVTVTAASGAAARDAVRAVGGSVTARADDQVSATVSKSALSRLGAVPGVTKVARPIKAIPLATQPSEGVAASNADDWQASSIVNGGAGVDIAVVDAGFQGLSTAVANGDLPLGTLVTGNACENVDVTDHGTATAEIVHQQAPKATIHLYCVDDNVGLNQLAGTIADDNQIVSCSLGFPGDGRGDGTGPANSVAAAVAKVRKAGVLWVNSAGNSGVDHWSGTLADANNDGAADLNGTGDAQEVDNVVVPGTEQNGGEPATAYLTLRFDQWPVSSAEVALVAFGYQCTDDQCEDDPTELPDNPLVVGQQAGTAPYLELPVTNTSALPRTYDIFVARGDKAFPKVRYDLDYEGAVSDSYLSEVNPTRAATGSIASPADSPYALAVGAADVGADGKPKGTIEAFSSQGPTIDGRSKPEITGWDGVSSPVYGPASADPNATTGFYGTSAAAPHVAGAAALIKAANPDLDAAEIQRALTDRASSGTGSNIKAAAIVPPSNQFGAGLLTLRAPATSPADVQQTSSRYTPIAPTRVLDTRSTLGGHQGALGANSTLTLALPDLPASATSVAVNLTGVGATAPTYMTVYSGTSLPPTSNLNLTKTDPTAAVFAVATVARASSGATPTIKIYNAAGSANVVVDVLGYFGTGMQTGRLTTLGTPRRVLDTRTVTGGHKGPLTAKTSVVVDPGAGVDATAAVVDLTALAPSQYGYLTASATCPSDNVGTTSLLTYTRFARSNLAIVPLDGNGRFCVTNVGGSVNALVDVVGYMSPSGSGSEFYPLASPQRIVDSRTGNGGYGNGRGNTPFAADATGVFTGSGVGTVPRSATALLTGVTEASASAYSYLTLAPGTSPSKDTSNLLFTAGRVVANGGVVGVAGGNFSVYNAAGTTQAAVDVAGYFAPNSGD